MNRILALFFLAYLTLTTQSQAQTFKFGITTSAFTDGDVLTAAFPGSTGKSFVIFETVLPAKSLDECMNITNPTGGRQADADCFRLIHNSETGNYEFGFFVERDSKPNCRVVSVRSTTESHDFNIWRQNYGRTSAMVDPDSSTLPRLGDGSVRHVSYSISRTTW